MGQLWGKYEEVALSYLSVPSADSMLGVVVSSGWASRLFSLQGISHCLETSSPSSALCFCMSVSALCRYR